MSKKGPKVLVVDDSPTDRYYMADLLDRQGYSVITAGSGEEAVSKVHSERPLLIVMDVVMPGPSGFQITRRLRRDPATEAIPVIIVSSKDSETDRIWGMRQGATDYLIKPVNPDEFLARVQALTD
jgi:twitching motility two-component system response regulator PilH